MPVRTVAYMVWPLATGALTLAVVAALGPHVALFVFGVSLIGFVLLISISELAPWAERRGIVRPVAFSLTIGISASVAWVVYILAVSLPIGFLTELPSTSTGRSAFFWLTVLPLPTMYVGFWRIIYLRARRAHLAR